MSIFALRSAVAVRRAIAASALAACSLAGSPVGAAARAPQAAPAPAQLHPQGFVSDFAHVLSPGDVAALDQRAQALAQQRGVQIAMVTVDSTGDDDITDYAFRLAQGWGVGQKGQDNGLLLLIAVQDHRYSTQVGYGLEPYLTDADTGAWMRALRPQLAAGQFAAVFNAMLDDIESTLQQRMGGGAARAQPPGGAGSAAGSSSGSSGSAAGLVFIVLVLILFGLFSRGRGGCLFPWLLMGGLGGPGYRGGWGGGFGGGFGGGGFGGFGGGGFGGGGSSGGW